MQTCAVVDKIHILLEATKVEANENAVRVLTLKYM